jgi:hypothetical protein
MILAIYKRNNPKQHWSIAYIAADMTTAKKQCQKMDAHAKQIGYDTAESIIQGFNSQDDVPATLAKVKSEAVLYN